MGNKLQADTKRPLPRELINKKKFQDSKREDLEEEDQGEDERNVIQ